MSNVFLTRDKANWYLGRDFCMSGTVVDSGDAVIRKSHSSISQGIERKQESGDFCFLGFGFFCCCCCPFTPSSSPPQSLGKRKCMIYLCLWIGFLTKIDNRRSNHEHIMPHMLTKTTGITLHQAQIFDFLDKDTEAQIKSYNKIHN